MQVPLLEQAQASKEVENMTPVIPHPRSWDLGTRLRIMWGNPWGFESPLPHFLCYFCATNVHT